MDFAFPSTGVGAVNRTMPARLNDVFNVKDFGALSVIGTGANDTPFIQKAIDAAIANHGGIVFFPPGNYSIGSKLVVPGTSDCGLIFQGSGGSPTEGGGTLLNSSAGGVYGTGIPDYILYIGHGPNTPVKSIQGISFGNSYIGGSNVTSTEPPTSGGDGRGGLYLGSGECVSILNCFVSMLRALVSSAAAPMLIYPSCTIDGRLSRTRNGR